MLRRRLIDDDSASYRVGQETSPIRAPARTAWAMMWLSNTKSSELRSNGKDASSSLLNARSPVWYSDSFWPSAMFSTRVRNLFATYLYRGIPPAMEFCARIREPITMSYSPYAIMDAIATTSLGEYW